MSHKSRHKHKHSKDRYYSRDHEEKRQQKKVKTISEDVSRDNNMTPAERLREKMKILLDKANDTSATPTISKPNEIEILAIESDQFVAQSFQSSRQPKEPKAPPTSLSHDNAIFGTTTTPPIITNSSAMPTCTYDINDEEMHQSMVVNDHDELRLKWIKKLTELRNQYTHPPMD